MDLIFENNVELAIPVVIAVIAILAALLLPALNSARDKANAIDCVSNMKQIQQALNGYADDHQDVFPGTGLSTFLNGASNWIYAIYSGNYLSNGAVFICKSQRGRKTDAADTDFLADPRSVNNYDNGSYGYNWRYVGTREVYNWLPTLMQQWYTGAKRNRIRKPSETISLADVSRGSIRDRGNYVCDYILDSDDRYAGRPTPRHSGGCNIAWVDGHVSRANRIDRENPYLSDPFRNGHKVGDPDNHWDLD